MLHKRFVGGFAALIIALSLSASVGLAQNKDKAEKKKEEAANAQGTPILWKEPNDIASRDYVDSFGNVCTRLVAPPGLLEVRNQFLIRDSGLPVIRAEDLGDAAKKAVAAASA